ncbi:OmpP1/FadL family transporter [Plebeiibacterium sediminum]|uniref:Outer membrane protein transport protein n=1 Tax=Plebeiibacterium sediminum TaxID=2992112 RepID=A0AAE3M550_9BACT|nr:outer membrane protein transport protein [Plebeiobacterium sediminum]MCW3787253.1 outer membrane protein transport protein [Plebeiobacterium sediminum]
MMKLKIKISALALLVSSALMSQTYQDVLRYSQPQYSGTARSVAMGGAFGSLGGDFSAIGINPAGIAAYRSSEFTFTPSLILNKTESNYNNPQAVSFTNISSEDNKTSFAINQIGYVGTYRPMRESSKGLISTHFGIGYNRNNNFNYRSMANARNVSNSMTDMFVINADLSDPDYLTGNTGLAYDAYLIDLEDPESGDLYYTNYLLGEDRVHQTKILEKKGYTGEFSFTFGANISNFLLAGGSINYSLLNYNENSTYFEEFSEDNAPVGADDPLFSRYTVSNTLDASGTGLNLKIGVILLPVKGLRVGLAYHSPTWYNIEETYTADINSIFFNFNREDKGYDGEYDYNFRTPDKLVASAAYIIGKNAILSFDYERINYAGAKYNSTVDDWTDITIINEQNEIIKDMFTSTNNFRAGIEYRINQQFSLRGGYALQGSPYKEDPKDNEVTSISAGFGYRFNNYFFDFAYKLSSYELNSYNYNWDPSYDANVGAPPIVKTDVKDSNIVFTFGLKF